MQAIRLRTEYLENPLGLDIRKPRLMWNCEDGIKQTAFEVMLRDENKNLLWESGKIKADTMYWDWNADIVLESRMRIYWGIKLWDEKDEAEPPMRQAYFEMGLLEKDDWRAKWITGNYKPKKQIRYPVDCFQKTISLLQENGQCKKIKKARIYATACGLYELQLQGEKIGEACLTPGYTDYNKRIQYQTFDVTQQLKKQQTQGEIVITAQLADGWYRGSVGGHGLCCQYGDTTKLLVQMEIGYEDGSQQVVVSDASWQWSNDGPIRFADNKDGERVDANKIPCFEHSAKLTEHSVVPTASNNVMIQEHEVFTPKTTTYVEDKIIYDFGQNMAGYISFSLWAKKGDCVTVELGEMLDEKGMLTLKNIQFQGKKGPTPLQKYEYICREGKNHYKTTFAISGFQYAMVTLSHDIPGKDNFEIKAHAIYSSFEEAGEFESSNLLLNEFVHATVWSTKGNSADIPTDCPTRERHGWTGDAQIFFGTASYLFDYASFARKFLKDVFDGQRNDGRIPQVVPYGGVDFVMRAMDGSVGWADICVLMPYRFYKKYQDRRILACYYDNMKKYVRFMEKRCGKWGGIYAKPVHMKGKYRKYLVTGGKSYGEWAEPQEIKKPSWWDFVEPHPEVQTAYTVYIMEHMIEIARILQKQEDVKEYQMYAENCRIAYQELVKQDNNYSLDTDRQAMLVRPLAMHLLDDSQETYAKKRLLQAIEHYGYRLGTGFLSTPFILEVLQNIDLDTTYRLLENEKIPGWLSMPKAGATTIWESWEGAKAKGDIASLNHYSKGALCQWLYENMCGIHVASDNIFTIAPIIGGHFTYAKCSYQSVYGKVSCGWEKIEEKTYRVNLLIPSNTTAHISLPDGNVYDVGAGKYEYRVTMP